MSDWVSETGRWGARCAQADEFELSELAGLRVEIDQVIGAAVDAWRAQGRSWATIGDALGISKQGAQKLYGRRPAEGDMK